MARRKKKKNKGWIKILNSCLSADKMIAYDAIRIYLGLGLFFKGIQFITNPTSLSLLMEGSQLQVLPVMVLHYIALAHLVGGLLLSAGLATRVAALVQVPILFGAVFFIHLSQGVATTHQNFEFAALVLFLLIIFSILGAGNFSVDKQVLEKK